MVKLMQSSRTPPPEIQRAQAGDRDAFNGLVEGVRSRLEALIRSRLNPSLQQAVEVQDAFQETVLRAIGGMERFEWRGEDSFFRWLGGIAVNIVFENAARGRRRGDAPPLDEVPVDVVSPSRALRREERFDRLQDALSSLSAEYRQVLVLVRLEGLPIKEVARRMDRSYKAVSHLLFRATRKLREVFGDTESLQLPDRRFTHEGGEDDA